MKNVLVVAGGVALVLALATLLLSMPVASAQTPLNTPTPAPAGAPPVAAANTDDPATAISFASPIKSLAPGSAEWLSFVYDSQTATIPRPTVSIVMLNGVANGLNFEVYGEEQIQNVWYDNPPTGKGTQEVIQDCTNATDQTGHCSTNNLVWSGGFGLDGTEYVRIINNTTTTQTPQLIIAGPGLKVCENPSQPAVSGQGTGTQPFAEVQCGNVNVIEPTPAPGN